MFSSLSFFTHTTASLVLNTLTVLYTKPVMHAACILWKQLSMYTVRCAGCSSSSWMRPAGGDINQMWEDTEEEAKDDLLVISYNTAQPPMAQTDERVLLRRITTPPSFLQCTLLKPFYVYIYDHSKSIQSFPLPSGCWKMDFKGGGEGGGLASVIIRVMLDMPLESEQSVHTF